MTPVGAWGACLLLACTFVGTLYLMDSGIAARDHPATIKCLPCPTALSLLLQRPPLRGEGDGAYNNTIHISFTSVVPPKLNPPLRPTPSPLVRLIRARGVCGVWVCAGDGSAP